MGAFAPSVRTAALPFAAGLALSVDGARGSNGVVFPALGKVLFPLKGLRAPARFGIFVSLSIGVLGALGLSVLQHHAGRRRGAATAVALAAVCLCAVEYWPGPVGLRAVATAAPPVYGWLATQEPGVVLELPVPSAGSLWGYETSYQFMSTFHWRPLINGYSGFPPPSYIATLDVLQRLPGDEALQHVVDRGVRYVLVHESAYEEPSLEALLKALDGAPAFVPSVRLPDATGAMTMVFRVDRPAKPR